MVIYEATSSNFKKYGRIVKNIDFGPVIEALNKIALPAEGVAYEPWIDSLEATGIFKELGDNAFGGMPIELGMCWGYNKALNCLEYHRNSEINIGATDFVLLLAKQEKIVDGKLNTADVVAFKAPAGAVVEVYATSLHYAPCMVTDDGFRVAVVLPKNTNTDLEKGAVKNEEDKMLWARNKWLIAHPDASEAKQGAYVGLVGENITI
jgi:hypothetical protein